MSFVVVVNTRDKKSSCFLSGPPKLPICPLTVSVNKTSLGEWTGTKLSSFVRVSYVAKQPCRCVPPCATVYLSSLQLGARDNTLFQAQGLVISRTAKLM